MDPLKTITLLPGIKSGGEASAGIYVRGGGPDQNLVLLDGIQVYNPNHLFGFFSIFNGEAVKNVEVIKGGMPAEYGGRLSSVITIDTKDGNKDSWVNIITVFAGRTNYKKEVIIHCKRKAYLY
jgi:outer membrane cobalamin receptor